MVSAPWLFLSIAVICAVFTGNALRPLRGPLWAVSFFAAWLTTELALHHLAWQGVLAAFLISEGALGASPGWVGLVILAVSSLGLVWLFFSAHRDGRVVNEALEAALGPGFRGEIADRFVTPHGAMDWGRVLMPFRMRHPDVERVRNLPYADSDHPRHRLDIYRPRVVPRGAPVLLQIHGGAWMIGRKDQQGLPLMYRMATRGWVCVAINYRLSPEATWPDHLVDCKRALRWVREHIESYGGDPNLVVVTGGSAGGHLAAMIGLTANDPEFQPGFEAVDTSVVAFVPFYGVFDWTDRFGLRGDRHPMMRRLERYIVKVGRHEAPHVYHRGSPMSHIDGDVPPAMVLHGTRDTLVPVAEAERFVGLLRSTSREPVVYAEFVGAHHAFEVFPSVRALHAINGVEAFAAWVVSRELRRRAEDRNAERVTWSRDSCREERRDERVTQPV
jgi:acetyl esterase/lipase